jgi:hypothetical protein
MNFVRQPRLARILYLVSAVISLGILVWIMGGLTQLYRALHPYFAAKEVGFRPGYLPANPGPEIQYIDLIRGAVVHIDAPSALSFAYGTLILVALAWFLDPMRGRGWLPGLAAILMLSLSIAELAVIFVATRQI